MSTYAFIICKKNIKITIHYYIRTHDAMAEDLYFTALWSEKKQKTSKQYGFCDYNSTSVSTGFKHHLK